MKVVLTRSMLPGDIKYIRDGLDREIEGEYDLVVPDDFTEDSICDAAADADILLGPYVTKRMLVASKNLKLIQVPWTGMDTFDFDAVRGTCVPVCNTHSNAGPVAELAVALVLDLVKKISFHDRKMREGDWNREQRPLSLRSRMMERLTVCVLGFGSIGSRVGKMLSAFGSRVLAVDDNALLSNGADAAYPSDQIEEAVASSDVVVCTLPLTEATRGLIDGGLISSMRDGVLLVNVSRACVVDEDAVWDALQRGKMGGFGSDVWWSAPKRGESASYPSERHEFWKLDNVVMSPHRAGFVEDCLPHLDGAIENIVAVARGLELRGLVDVDKGY